MASFKHSFLNILLTSLSIVVIPYQRKKPSENITSKERPDQDHSIIPSDHFFLFCSLVASGLTGDLEVAFPCAFGVSLVSSSAPSVF